MVSSFCVAILAGRMAIIEHTESPQHSPAYVAAAVRRLSQQTLMLLPGALALLGFQIFAIARGLNHLDGIERVVLSVGAVSTAGSALLLIALLRRLSVARSQEPPPPLQAISLSLAGITSALLVGATLNIALGIAVTTGSWTTAGVAAGLLVGVTCWICW